MDGKKISKALVIFAAAAILGVAAALLFGDERHVPRRPGSSFLIPKDELVLVVASANSGDLPSIRRLIYYFEQYESDLDKAKYWSKRAREQGDESELRLYAFELLIQGRYYAQDAEQKKKVLAEALVIAERVVAINRTAENERLLRQIKSEQSRLRN